MQRAVSELTKVDVPRLEGAGIQAPKFKLLTVPVKNLAGSPLVINAFSAKARQMMREAQEAGSLGNKKKNRAPKNFDEVYQGARHISTEGWDGATAATFRYSMISACRLVGFKMTVGKLSLFVDPDGISRTEGTPLVRIYGEPTPWEGMVRNATGVADIRIRPRWDEWAANVKVRFDSSQFSEDDVLNLMIRAGAQCGVCEGRPDAKSSFGQGWGLYEIDTSKPIELVEMAAPQIKITRR